MRVETLYRRGFHDFSVKFLFLFFLVASA